MATEPSRDTLQEDFKELDRLYHKLRGLVNALGLCVRVMESGPPPQEMDEYAQLIAQTSAQIEQLVQKLGINDKHP